LQATLLGLGIAIILALVAALVGPHFIEWSEYRGVFESSISRLVGMPVRVNGRIDVRILPAPSLVLRDVETAGTDGRPGFKARSVAVELELGPLLRGQWHAAELRLVRPELTLALTESGRLSFAELAPRLDPDTLSIERFALEDGQATLRDAASASAVVLDKIWFNGDLRSLAGPVKGEGGFVLDDERYGYRVSLGRAGSEGARLRLNLDPSERPVAIEADGILRLERGVPRYEGSLGLGRPSGVFLARGRAMAGEPWRLSAKLKLTPTDALVDQIDVQYGPGERGIKLAGTAQVRLGKDARVDAVVSARQLDLDRATVLPEGARRLPFAVLRGFAESFEGVLGAPIPIRLGVGIDTVTLGGANLQNLRGDFSSDGGSWNLETIEFRAPGPTQVRASGRLALAGGGATFRGPAALDSSDPKALLAWLEGRSEVPQGLSGVMRASGELTLGADRIAVERLEGEIDRKAVAGRLAYAWATDARPARLEGQLTAAELDIDQAIGAARAALAGTTLDAPGEAALAVDIGVATIGGVAAKSAKVKLSFDQNGLVLERVAVADLGGAALDLNGRIEQLLTAPRGTLTLDLDASRLDGVIAVVAQYAPQAVDTLRALGPRLAPARLSALLNVERVDGGGSRADVTLTGKAGAARINLTGDATGDPAQIAAAETNINGRIYADDGAGLAALFGLDRVVAVEKRPASLSVTASGRAGGLRVDGRLTAARLEGSANGTLRLAGDDAGSGELDLKFAAADAIALRRGPERATPVTVRTRLAFRQGQLTFDRLSAVVAGAGIRGRLAVGLGQPLRIDGRLEADTLDLAGVTAAAAGFPAGGQGGAGGWPSEPFGSGAFGALAGQITFQAQQATLSPTLSAQDVRGIVTLEGDELTLEDVEGRFSGGRLTGQLQLRSSPLGLALRTRLALADIDAATLFQTAVRSPLTGRLALQAELEGSGLSPATLVGSLRGAGTLSLEATQIAGLAPTAFDTVIRAIDRGGIAIDVAKVRDLMDTALASGRLIVPRVDGAFSVSGGQARWGTVVGRGEGADLAIGGIVDLADWALDARLTLSATAVAATEPAGGRPEVFLALKGPIGSPSRTLDVAAFSGWLTLRAVERQSKRLELLESERQEATVEPSPAATSTVPGSEPGAKPAPPTAGPETRTEPARPRAPPVAPKRATTPAEPAPPLPPPIEIRPQAAPRVPAGDLPKPRENSVARPPTELPPPPPPRRSLLEQLFGSQR
jgi:uncharacterized protein involved in outer membrane biogenesis